MVTGGSTKTGGVWRSVRGLATTSVIAVVLWGAFARADEVPPTDPAGADAAVSAPTPAPPASAVPAALADGTQTTATTVPTTAPTTAPTAPTTAPTTPPTAAPTAATRTAFERCIAAAAAGQPATDVRLCLDDLAHASPDSLDAVRAHAALSLLDAEATAVSAAAQAQGADAPFFRPGRLELVGVMGVFGVWNAVAAGVSVASVVEADPGPAFLGTAAGALVAGVGFGVGGYYLGDALALDETESKLVGAGIIWGTNVGIASSVLLSSTLQVSDTRFIPATLVAPVVVAGYLGGVAGLATGGALSFTPAGVSIVNSGGALGSFVGGMVDLNLLAGGVGGTAPYVLTYIGGNVMGLVAGGVLAQSTNFTWSETLVGDLGMVLGGTVAGLGTAGALLTISTSGDQRVLVGIVTGAATAGAVGGYAAGLWAAQALRPSPSLATQVSFAPASGAALDRTGALVPTFGASLRF